MTGCYPERVGRLGVLFPRDTKGLNPDDGGADMVIYTTDSGGAVFSVGSIVWPSCVLVDDGVSKITSNVLTRFLG